MPTTLDGKKIASLVVLYQVGALTPPDVALARPAPD